MDNKFNSMYFIVDGRSICPFVVTTYDHAKLIPINTSVTPPTYGNAKMIISQNSRFSKQQYYMMCIKWQLFVYAQ